MILKIIRVTGSTDWNKVELKYTPFKIPKGKPAEIVTRMYKNRVRIIDWKVNIQFSFGVSADDIERLASKVQSLFDIPSPT